MKPIPVGSEVIINDSALGRHDVSSGATIAMAVKNYHSIDGRLIVETTNGVRTDYLTDALRSSNYCDPDPLDITL